jgi:hypothetical protein
MPWGDPRNRKGAVRSMATNRPNDQMSGSGERTASGDCVMTGHEPMMRPHFVLMSRILWMQVPESYLSRGFLGATRS